MARCASTSPTRPAQTASCRTSSTSSLPLAFVVARGSSFGSSHRLRASFGSLHSAAQRRQLFAAQRQLHEGKLAKLRDQAKETKGDPYARATVDFAITYERALIKWLDAVKPS